MPENPTSDKPKLTSSQKEKLVLALRYDGKNWAEIAEIVGYADRSGAKLAFRRAQKKYDLEPDIGESIADMEILRDRCMKLINDPECSADTLSRLGGTLIRAHERIAALKGHDAPDKHRLDVIPYESIVEYLSSRKAELEEAEAGKNRISLPRVIAEGRQTVVEARVKELPPGNKGT